MTIYELQSEYLQLMEMADDPDVTEDAFFDTWEAIDGAIEDKADGYARVIQSLSRDVEKIDAEIKRLTSRKKTIENNVQRMKNTLYLAMKNTEKPKFKTSLFSFTIQLNPPSVVMDEQYIENIPEKYLKYKDPEIDKTKIKEDLKNGIDIGGIAHLEQGESLRIR